MLVLLVQSPLVSVSHERDFRIELDSHADTSVVGETTGLLIHDYNRPVRVHGYDESVGQAKNCKTVSAVVAYDHPATGETFFLVIHQAILIPGMTNILLSTMQMRDNGLKVNDEPKYTVLTPTEDHHAITVPDLEVYGEPFRIPLSLNGVVSYAPVRVPTAAEYENSDLGNRIELTCESIEWDPNSEHFGRQENAMIDAHGRLRERVVKRSNVHDIAAFHTIRQEHPPDNDFGRALSGNVMVRWEQDGVFIHQESDERAIKALCATKEVQALPVSERRSRTARIAHVRTFKALKTQRKKHSITPMFLAKRWNIGLAAAEKTLEVTTQNGVRTVLHPSLSRRFRTNDRQLRYRRLSHPMFTDTLEAKTTSWMRQSRYAQVFATRFHWVRAFPMKKKSDAHKALSLLVQRDGVPTELVMDGAREQIMGNFNKKWEYVFSKPSRTLHG